MTRRFAAALALLAALAPRASAQPPAPAALKTAFEEIIDRTVLKDSRVGLQVLDLDSGKLVYARNPDDLLNPASNVKLFTTAAALVRLGPEFRFDTELLTDRTDPKSDKARRTPKPGELPGNLYVRGKGDPSLTTERLWSLVNELYLAGIRVVEGDLVLDDGYFDEESFGPGFDQEHSDKTYLAPAGALSLNSNAFGIYVLPGDKVGAPARIELDPASDYFVVENRATTGREKSLRRLSVSSQPQGDKQKIVVSGRIPLGHPSSSFWKRVDNPTSYFGRTLAQLMGERGMRVRGKLRRGAAPKDALAVLVHQSETLDLVLKRVNKNSSNFMAEQLVKTLGAQMTGGQGSWPSGVAAIEEFLSSEVGIPRGTFVMKNGSGLNDTNRFSAAQVCKLLRHMWQRFPLAPEYLSSLGIAGKDGTLHFRMEGTEAVGRLRAKTGTLENVSSLSGYVQAVGGERFAFAILVNDFPGRVAPVVGGLDALGAALAALGSPGGPAAGVAQALAAAPRSSPLDELAARVATYETLALAKDKRNVTFLRTALRAERDPAIKSVIADAIFRSDPDDSAGERALVEAFDPGPNALGRLREVAGKSKGPTPGLAALIRIAGEGNAEALAKLVEVAALAGADEALRDELLDPMAEVARNAPDELIAALRAAREASRAAALDLIAKSLTKAAEADHPFPAAVRRAQEAADPQLAGFAKSLDEALSVRIAAEKAPKVDPAAPAPATSPEAAPKKDPAAKPAELRSGG